VHIVNNVSAAGAWQPLKASMLSSLYDNKTSRTLAIIAAGRHDVAFVQEAASAFPAAAQASSSPLHASHFVVAPTARSKSDQNSLLLLSRTAFDPTSVRELSDRALALCPTPNAPVASGDLLAISVQAVTAGPADFSAPGGAPTKYLLASFHGDTNGLASLPVLHAMHALAQQMPDHALVFGLDANTHLHGQPGVQP
jgi:hypothetical protein